MAWTETGNADASAAVGPAEPKLLEDVEMRAFPPRLPNCPDEQVLID